MAKIDDLMSWINCYNDNVNHDLFVQECDKVAVSHGILPGSPVLGNGVKTLHELMGKSTPINLIFSTLPGAKETRKNIMS